MEHASDAYSIGFEPFWVYEWHQLDFLQFGPFNVTPTKHVFFLFLAAFLVFLTMRVAGQKLKAQRASENAPKGFANAIEAIVLFVRNDIAIANIGHDGAKFAPFIMSLFFFILYANVLGLVPWGSTATGNLAVTGGLAILSFLVIEISGFRKLGPAGYLGTIFPTFPGVDGAFKWVMWGLMGPIEILGKLVKPFALMVRLFGNMTAGHFVVLSLFGIIFLFGDLGIFSWGIGVTTAVLVLAIMMLELFVALLQAYVFALLTAVFIGLMQHEH